MASKVFFAPIEQLAPPEKIERRLKDLLNISEFEKIILPNDFVAVKTHFGEKGSITHVPPRFFRPLSARIKQVSGHPFLTETSTLYKGNRSDALCHLSLAFDHGFTQDVTGMPVMMADGLKGVFETEVAIGNGTRVMVAGLLKKVNSIVAVSHPTGHIALCFGGTVKNLGMGLSSRKGKLIQHSSVKPSINLERCTGCGHCVRYCPENSITVNQKKAAINAATCVGCGECLTECRFDAVLYNWEQDKTRIQETTAEHAKGVVLGKQGFYINYLLNFTKDCDCFGTAKTPVIPDIGLLASTDPVAVDSAAMDLIEKRNKPLPELSYEGLDPRIQLRHGEAIGLGSMSYELIEC